MHENILIVEDELIVAGDIRITLERAHYKVIGIARTVERALEMIAMEKPFLVLLDIYLKGYLTGIDLAVKLNEMDIPFVYLSANSNQQVLEKAKATNPFGFIVKPFREKDVLINLDIARYRVEQNKKIKTQINNVNILSTASLLETKNASNSLRETISNVEGIVGNSEQMKIVFELIDQVAPLTTSVLILGESGTGKEGVANAIHKRSPRAGKPFIKINCVAIPATLIESELFGHEKGSFTGAYDRKIGKFEQASGGTILLDEIGEMTTDMQVKLLRVLQEKEIERIGGTSTIKVDVRIIAATNKILEKEIAEGRFRIDLYYRLHVFPIVVPPLRERKDDIPLLADYFLQLFAKRNGQPLKYMSKKALQQLMDYSWPGNVREMENVMERTILLTTGDVISDVKMPHNFRETTTVSDTIKTLHEIEGAHILEVLKKCNNRISGVGGAAELLNLPPSTLYSKIKKLGIVRKFT